jgi:hypothetical protein
MKHSKRTGKNTHDLGLYEKMIPPDRFVPISMPVATRLNEIFGLKPPVILVV